MKKAFVATILLAFSLPISGWGQSIYGSLVGVVTDPAGAVVPKAKVTITSKVTGIEREVTTGVSGEFLAPNLDASEYSVVVKKDGFATASREQVSLLARQVVRVDVRLELEAAQQTVDVTGTAAVIQTDVPTISDSRSGREINELALNFRATSSTSPLAVATLAPGVQKDRSGQISISGMQPYTASVSIDGISTLNARLNGPVDDLFPSVESIEEFRISSVNNSAEFSQASDITATTRSGTNDYHGDGYWFHQNKALNATNPFAPFDPSNRNARLKPALVANAFGAVLGGPVTIPHVYNGKNKTFFFFDYEGVRRPSQSTLRQVVPPDAWRNGDFSSLSTPLLDPSTGAPFPGNKVPVSAVSAKALDLLFERQNQPTGASISQPNFIVNVPGAYTQNGFDLRGDHNVSANQKFFVRYTQKNISRTGPPSSSYNTRAGLFSQPTDVWNLAGSYSWILRPNLFNEFRAGYSDSTFNSTYPLGAQGKSIVSQLGITNLPANPPQGGLPLFAFTDGSITVASSPGLTNPIKSKTLVLADSLTWIRGRHTLKAGLEIQRLEFQDISSYNVGDDYGEYYFNSGTPGVQSYTGLAFADFLLGIPRQTAKALNGPDFKPWRWSKFFYVQDEWRMTRKLTLSFGLRYELHPPFNDSTRQLANFDRDFPGGRVVVQDKNLIAPAFLQSIGKTPIVAYQEAGLPETLRFTDKNNFTPRFGCALRPFDNNRTVIRGGFGVYTITILGRVLYSLEGVANGSFLSFSNAAPAAVRAGTTPFEFPNVFPQGTGDDPGLPDYRRANPFHFVDPYSMQWNFTIEHDLGWNTGLRLTYNGQRQIDLVLSPDINQVRPNTLGYAKVQETRPFPAFNAVLDRANGLTGKYHAFTTEVTKRFSNGISFQNSWVWAKNLSNANGVAPSAFSAENGPTVHDYFDTKHDYGDVAFTRRHRFVGTFLWELPVGRGHRFMKGLNPAGDALIGGWQLSGITTLQTGPYLTPSFSGADPSGTGANVRGVQGTQRPDRVGNGSLENPTRERWFDRSAFVIPADNIGRFGNSGVGILKGPGTKVFSMSVAKNFTLYERLSLRYEATFANLFNHTNLDIPSSMNIGSGSFGQINATQAGDLAGPRTIQMSLRLRF